MNKKIIIRLAWFTSESYPKGYLKKGKRKLVEVSKGPFSYTRGGYHYDIRPLYGNERGKMTHEGQLKKVGRTTLTKMNKYISLVKYISFK